MSTAAAQPTSGAPSTSGAGLPMGLVATALALGTLPIGAIALWLLAAMAVLVPMVMRYRGSKVLEQIAGDTD